VTGGAPLYISPPVSSPHGSDDFYLVRVGGRGDYRLAHVHDDAQPAPGAVCGARLSVGHWALEDAEVSRLRRLNLCARCIAALRDRASNHGMGVL